MGVFDKASLALVPDGIKDGKLYSIKPTDGSGDFTFERGANLAATRVDENGLIEKGRENLLLQSNQFDTTWSKTADVTGGQSGYDESSDAWLLEANSVNQYERVSQSVTTTGLNTFSIYAKADTADFLLIYNNNFSRRVWFNLSTGSVGSSSLIVSATIEAVGSGWYRCSVVMNLSSSSQYWVCVANTDNDVNATTGDSIYIQHAQLEQGLLATDYIETGASTAQAGVLEDLPRIDYTSGTPSLLLEPDRTNLIDHSEYFDHWTNSEETDLSANNTTSPEGVQNAYSITPQATSNFHRIFKSVNSITIGNQISFSFFAKSNGNNFILVRMTADNLKNVCFNISNGTIDFESSAVDDAQIEDYGNGWYRCIVIWTALGTNQQIYLRSQISSQVGTDDGIYTFTGNGNGAYLYGAQLEEASYPTSYIPTYGTAATRGVDSFEKTGLSSVIGQTEGTIFFEFEYFHQKINRPFFQILEDSSNLYEIIALSDFKLRSRARIENSFLVSISTASVITEGIHKVAIIYKSGDYRFYLDGSLVDSSTENSILSNPSEINYFNNNNNLKQFLIFPTALSDAECITLTT
jgi:hypothetical protein